MTIKSDMAHLERMFAKVNVLKIDSKGCLWYNKNDPDGKNARSWKSAHSIQLPLTPLNECDICGRLASPRVVQVRNDVFGWNFPPPHDPAYFSTPIKDTLCTGCWNKVRPAHYRKQQATENDMLIRKLKRTITETANAA